MPDASNEYLTARCACGGVEIKAFGTPIGSLACHCDDCQEGSRRIEALPGAGLIRDPAGGTAYVVYRKDRIRYTNGAHLLKKYKIRENSATSRSVASCCNSAMVMTFADVRHWVPVYRARFKDGVPPLQMRVCTKFKPSGSVLPDDVPAYKMFAPKFMFRLLASRIAMLLGRGSA
jgi:hypothetical protein